MSRRREQREAQASIDRRLTDLNQCLSLISLSKVEGRPIGLLQWEIVPVMRWATLPLKCKGLTLKFHEEIMALPTDNGVNLTCQRFEYKLEALESLTDQYNRKLIAGWHFLYELNDRGAEHLFKAACTAAAIKQATHRRLPAYHLHVAENSDIRDDLHYPIGEPSEPLNIAFEIIRLISDEFVEK